MKFIQKSLFTEYQIKITQTGLVIREVIGARAFRLIVSTKNQSQIVLKIKHAKINALTYLKLNWS